MQWFKYVPLGLVIIRALFFCKFLLLTPACHICSHHCYLLKYRSKYSSKCPQGLKNKIQTFQPTSKPSTGSRNKRGWGQKYNRGEGRRDISFRQQGDTQQRDMAALWNEGEFSLIYHQKTVYLIQAENDKKGDPVQYFNGLEMF